MKLSKASRYAIAFFFVLVILVLALGPLIAIRSEGFKSRKAVGQMCQKASDCLSNKCELADPKKPQAGKVCKKE